MNTEAAAPADELTLRDVRVTDAVHIRTLNSRYTFLMIDPVKGRGVLLGGCFGWSAAEAVICRPPGLKKGLRALMLVDSGGGWRFVTTSAITGLSLVEAEDRARYCTQEW